MLLPARRGHSAASLYSSSWPELRRHERLGLELLRGGEHFFRARTKHATLFEILP